MVNVIGPLRICLCWQHCMRVTVNGAVEERGLKGALTHHIAETCSMAAATGELMHALTEIIMQLFCFCFGDFPGHVSSQYVDASCDTIFPLVAAPLCVGGVVASLPIH